MRSRLAAAACLFPLCTGCPYDGEWESQEVERGPLMVPIVPYQELRITREAGAPPPTLYAQVALSDFAVARFYQLLLTLHVYSAESIEGQGLRAEWLGDFGGEPVRASFGGALSATWSAELPVTSNPCAEVPCALTLKLAPEGDWSNELSFVMQYEVQAELELTPGGYEHGALASALQLTLQENP
jgi:hypothetical protein